MTGLASRTKRTVRERKSYCKRFLMLDGKNYLNKHWYSTSISEARQKSQQIMRGRWRRRRIEIFAMKIAINTNKQTLFQFLALRLWALLRLKWNCCVTGFKRCCKLTTFYRGNLAKAPHLGKFFTLQSPSLVASHKFIQCLKIRSRRPLHINKWLQFANMPNIHLHFSHRQKREYWIKDIIYSIICIAWLDIM